MLAKQFIFGLYLKIGLKVFAEGELSIAVTNWDPYVYKLPILNYVEARLF